MEELMKIFKKYEVTEFELAEMVYAYLIEHGESEDENFKEEIYTTFFNRHIDY